MGLKPAAITIALPTRPRASLWHELIATAPPSFKSYQARAGKGQLLVISYVTVHIGCTAKIVRVFRVI